MTLRIITLNLNGIRSAARKGVFTWLQQQNADVICLQEIKAQAEDMSDPAYLAHFQLAGYAAYFHFAEKKGYSGVGIYTRHQPQEIITGLDWQSVNEEGRYIAIVLDKLTIASVYFPSGTAGPHRQAVKFEFLENMMKHLKKILQTKKEYILCGDWNIAHKIIDLKNWRGNQKNSGFLPAERAWLDQVFDELGWVDAFRQINTLPEQYTWWSNRGQAWAKNVGWRIDYQVVTPGLKGAIQSATIYKEQRFSDHAPLIMEYQLLCQ